MIIYERKRMRGKGVYDGLNLWLVPIQIFFRSLFWRANCGWHHLLSVPT